MRAEMPWHTKSGAVHKWSWNWKKPVSLLLILTILFVLSSTPTVVHADAPEPTIAVGDWWTYDQQSGSGSYNSNATATMTVTGKETITSNSVIYSAFRTEMVGAGLFEGSPAGPIREGNWNFSFVSHITESGQSLIVSRAVTVFWNDTFWLTSIMEEENNPPSTGLDFPLSVGKSWTVSTTASINQTTFDSLNPTQVTNLFTNAVTRTHTVNRTETVTVPAGTFEAFLVSHSDAQTRTEAYYSPQVGGTVKSTLYDKITGNVLSSVVLTAYYSWPYRSSFQVSARGATHNIAVRSTTTISAFSQNPTGASFTVSGEVTGSTGISGRLNVSIPKTLNDTSIKVYVDSALTTASITQNSTHYHVFLTISLSTHNVNLVFLKEAGSLFSPYVIAGIAALAAIAIGLVFFLSKRRRVSTGPGLTAKVPE